MPDLDRKPRKLRRNTRACDQCSKRSVKCKPSTEDPGRCQNCVDYDELCAFERETRRRAGRSSAHASQRGLPRVNTALQPETAPTESTAGDTTDHWSTHINADAETILGLIDAFFDVIFPVFPFFHKGSLMRRVVQGHHRTDAPFAAAIAALCGLVSARVRDGALYKPRRDSSPATQAISSQAFFKASEEMLPKSASLTQHLGYMQACVLLALTSIQYGHSTSTQYYLNLYHTFVAVGSLHDEDSWPQGLEQVEIEERRRLFWSTYTLDVFTSIIWKRPVRGGEAHFNVSYPSIDGPDWYGGSETIGADDPVDQLRPSWLLGWNFVTDLYRILEHVLQHLRRQTSRTPALHIPVSTGCESTSALLEVVMTRYNALAPVFKSTSNVTGRLGEDLYSFQAANIAATVQLVRMVLFTVEGSSTEQKCQIASEVIDAFGKVPTAYLRAISSPLLFHLSGIGMIMASTFQESLSDASYSRIRTVLLELASLIANLEVGTHSSAGTSAKLRSQVATIDQYWTTHIMSRVGGPDQTPGTAFLTPRQALGDTQLQQAIPTNRNDDPVFLPPQLLEDWSWVFDLTQDFTPAVDG